jgi:uncharacterized protein (DUF1800 family)
MNLALQLLPPLCLFVAVAVSAQPLGPDRAQRLLTRAGFAPPPAEVERFAALTQQQAVDRLLAETLTAARTPAPAWVDDAIVGPRALRALGDEERKLELQKNARRSLDLKRWWIAEMATTPSPLTERMTLFWHNHFVSAQPKVRWPQLMYRQNTLLRRHALGNFGTLLHTIARDPAMLVYLDMATSRRGSPNENFARELMELFVLGQGHYGEHDVKEAARAFTGFSLDPESLAFRYRPGLHDGGSKSVLGSTGPLAGDDVLDILLAQPAAAEFIAGKLWREFVSPEPDAARVAAIARRFRESGYDIAAAVREVLQQPEVVDGRAENALVKSPTELAIGLVRQSGARIASDTGLAAAVAAMGQSLYAPPNVRGWPGGESWINTQTLLVRKQFIERSLASPAVAAGEARAILAAAEPPSVVNVRRRLEAAQVMAVHVDAAAVLESYGELVPERPLPAAEIERLAGRLLASTPAAMPAPGTLAFDAVRALLLDPAYQLK